MHSATSNTNQHMLIGVIVGTLLGMLMHLVPEVNEIKHHVLFIAQLLGTLFVDLLKMVLVPLVFCSIVTGISNLRHHQRPDRVWKLTLGFFITSMAIAIVIGLTASQLFHPGKGMSLALLQDKLVTTSATSLSFSDFTQQFLHGLFMNPFAALSQGNILAIVCFSILVGIALTSKSQRDNHLIDLFEDGLKLALHLVDWVMRLAPLGVGALLLKLIATQDSGLLISLMQFVLIIIGSTLLHGILVLPGLLWLFTRMTPLQFWGGAKPALITAFATSSSSATLPITLNTITKDLHVKPEIAGFVIPLGATLNMDGTALYEAAAALFIANLAGIELSLAQQVIVFFMAMIAAMGAPGIPSAGMVTMVMVLQSVGLPAEAIAILLPIDRLLDTLRTTVNVEGDMVGSLIVQQLTTEK